MPASEDNPTESAPPIPTSVRNRTSAQVAKQRVSWKPAPWTSVFAGHDRLLGDLSTEVEECGGITRRFVHDRSDGDPGELFLAAMAWGWGTVGYGPTRVAHILEQPGSEAKVHQIVDTTRTSGAAAGWTALLADNRIPGLGMAFGTKLLYFAGYSLGGTRRPLILDARVRKGLQEAAPGTVPPPGQTVWRDDYVRYLDLACTWSMDPTWDEEPDVVEFALFDEQGQRPDAEADSTDADAQV